MKKRANFKLVDIILLICIRTCDETPFCPYIFADKNDCVICDSKTIYLNFDILPILLLDFVVILVFPVTRVVFCLFLFMEKS